MTIRVHNPELTKGLQMKRLLSLLPLLLLLPLVACQVQSKETPPDISNVRINPNVHWPETCTQFDEGHEANFPCRLIRDGAGRLDSIDYVIRGNLRQRINVGVDYWANDKNPMCLTNAIGGGGGSICLQNYNPQGTERNTPQGVTRNTPQQAQENPLANPLLFLETSKCATKYRNNASAFDWCVNNARYLWGR